MASKTDQQHQNTVRIGAPTGASFTTISAPVKLNRSPDELASLPEDRRQIVNLISAAVDRSLTKWQHFEFELPQTEFVQHSSGSSVPLVTVAQLCTLDATTELEDITVDPDTGRQRRITREQCSQISQHARFSFPSRASHHFHHVWQLPWWMVRGRKSIENDFRIRKGYALDHFFAYIPNRIYPKRRLWSDERKKVKLCGKVVWRIHSPSIANGIQRIGHHISCIVAAFIGLPETIPRRKLQEYRRNTEAHYVRQTCANCELPDFSNYFEYALRCLTTKNNRAEYDDRYRLAPLNTFQVISPDVVAVVDRNPSDGVVISVVDHNNNNLSITKRVSHIQDFEEVQCRLRDNNQSDKKTRLVFAEHRRAQNILHRGRDKLRARVAREKLRFINQAKKAHPTLSLRNAWLEQWVLRKGIQHYAEWQRTQEDENIALMRSCGLDRAAKFEESRLQFRREEWPKSRASWLQDRVVAKEYKHTYVIFNPRRWREGGESDTQEVLTTTAHTGWRLTLLGRDMRSFLRNGLYHTIVINLWRGPVGLQTLFRSRDVPYSWSVGANGTVRARMVHLSMYTRLQAIWRGVREHCSKFEQAEDTSFVGKDKVRWLHYIMNYGIRGGVSTALVIVVQPTLTVINLFVTVFIAATAVVWAPLSALVAYMFSFLVYDWRHFKRHKLKQLRIGDSHEVYAQESTSYSPKWFVVPRKLFRIAANASEALISTIGLAAHPTYSVLRILVACVQRGFRMAWDAPWHLFIRRFGRWPARDSFLAKRVSGLGVSGICYFRLSTDLVLSCVRARLELFELSIAYDVVKGVVRRPMWDVEELTMDLLKGLCVTVGAWDSAIMRLREAEKGRLHRVNEAFREREMMLRRLTSMPDEKERIRAEGGVPSEVLLEKCEEVVKRFYEERISKLGDSSMQLWARGGVTPGDFSSLTKYLLEELFSEKFLTPVEETEETMEIRVTFGDVVNVYARPRYADRVRGEEAC